ncbi:MAG: hypothetical protein DHS20C05_15800 [Hyphococcus sp.]|nr:MAG: hypothetical protein DHS20C05_15800 [Marinicaulis sp.]
MPSLEMSTRIDWRKFEPTRTRLYIAIAIWAAIVIPTTAVMYWMVLTGRSDVVIGGDFLAFYAAAKASLSGAATEIYNAAYFQNQLEALAPHRDDIKLTWQYPPTYLLFVSAFGFAPYLLSYTLWATASAISFFAVLRNLINDRLILLAAFACPSAYMAYITGQNGFLSAALITIAVVYPKSRPIFAGIAAGLLTYKPQLGLLIPLAYLAGGCWRAFISAALTAIGLAAISLAAFGIETWAAFFDSILNTSALVTSKAFPLAKMATPYTAALFAGLPVVVAKLIYVLFSGVSVFVVWRTWRSDLAPLWKASALLSVVFFTAPYGFHYELIILALPVAYIAHQAVENSWLKYEKLMMAIAVMLPFGFAHLADMRQGPSIIFITVLLIFVMTMRRINVAAPGIFEFKKKLQSV